ncbi:MAG: 50S ribosomal protein L20 [Candidatus Liptonbacteria bacterium RIFCSPHIGHO2_01_FULL_57_28]|uniref:Large ribosomal subunit protein bL20 n=1 Tax=Candidatus Liptonbacteria bacterium RIFCSPHIGHO2_01_FULL_57_28 TaxID=1798647 RepID=A0A1G2CDQ3_9BACT|nr:MAG: 50S ribosomal protein L20 [Candidatus Liptonbacteria bacterium RIFCSPHIGHO2_01_FULL_57_28]
MPRVKRGTIAHKKRERLLKKVKGYRWGRKSKERAAKEALLHAQSRMFRGRKEKKRNFRSLWTVRLNAAARENGTTYSKLIAGMKKNKIELDRKVLADMAQSAPDVLKKVIEKALA